jgi:hypothetical protein
LHDLVIVTGMHRSGTSLVCRLLNLCGMELGDAEDLLPPAADNPDGFWENRRFVEVNTAVLRANGEAWDWPNPAALQPEGLELEALRSEATTLVKGFAKGAFRGWKDPRNCLTLPFWLSLEPEALVVLVVRHPVEVAESLARRNHVSDTLGLGLWLIYHERLLQAVRASHLIVTHFDSYFETPERELSRVVGRLNVATTTEEMTRACAAVSPGSRHAHLAPEILKVAAPDLMPIYGRLCRAAGRRIAESGETPASSHIEETSTSNAFGRRSTQLGPESVGAGRSRAGSGMPPAWLHRELEKAWKMLREERLSMAILAELERELREGRQQIATMARELDLIHASRFWRIVDRYWHLRRRLARWGRSEG